jgi:small GTP-binding protein
MIDTYEPYTQSPRHGLGSLFSPWDWEQVRQEVEQECQARIAIVGMGDAGKSTLFNRLRGWDVSPVGSWRDDSAGVVQEDLGAFLLVDLPATEPDTTHWRGNGFGETGWVSLTETDLVVFVLDATHQLSPTTYQWFSRIRALRRPLLATVNKVDVLDGSVEEVRRDLERHLATSVIPISALEGTNIEELLLPRMIDANPSLAVPLGREIIGVRRVAAARLIRRTAILSAVTGVEPLPLLDIPIQLATQMKLLMRLAALHGQAGATDGSRELLASVAGGLGVRFGIQQLAKLFPVLGWAASGLLSGLTTWMLGWAAVAYFDGRLPAPHLPRKGNSLSRGWRHSLGQGISRIRPSATGLPKTSASSVEPSQRLRKSHQGDQRPI